MRSQLSRACYVQSRNGFTTARIGSKYTITTKTITIHSPIGGDKNMVAQFRASAWCTFRGAGHGIGTKIVIRAAATKSSLLHEPRVPLMQCQDITMKTDPEHLELPVGRSAPSCACKRWDNP